MPGSSRDPDAAVDDNIEDMIAQLAQDHSCTRKRVVEYVSKESKRHNLTLLEVLRQIVSHPKPNDKGYLELSTQVGCLRDVMINNEAEVS